MAWPVPSLMVAGPPPSPRLWRWAVLLAAFLVIGACATLAFWPPAKPAGGVRFWSALAGIPILFWVVAFAVRMLLHANACEAAAVLKSECEAVSGQWREWGARRVAIIGAAVVTPDADLVERIVGASGDTEAHPGSHRQLERIDRDAEPEDRRTALVASLLEPLGHALMRIPPGLEIVAPAVIGTTRWDDAPGIRDVLEGLSDGKVRGMKPMPGTDKSPAVCFSRSADEQRPQCQLVVATQLWGNELPGEFTEAGAAVLLMPEAMAEAMDIRPLAWLYRPMPTTVGTIQDDIVTMQASHRELPAVSRLWLSGLDQAAMDALLIQWSAANDAAGKRAEKIDATAIDQFVGVPGPLREWIAFAMSCHAASLSGADQCCAAGYEGRITLSRVAQPENQCSGSFDMTQAVVVS